jgi:hypothetical protein
VTYPRTRAAQAEQDAKRRALARRMAHAMQDEVRALLASNMPSSNEVLLASIQARDGMLPPPHLFKPHVQAHLAAFNRTTTQED